MLDLLRPFMPGVLLIGTLWAIRGIYLTVRGWRVIEPDITPRDWSRHEPR